MAGERSKKGKGSRKVSGPSEFVQASGSIPLDPGDLLAKLESKIKVIHGASDDIFKGLVGQKVSTVRAALVDAFNIPVDAIALVNGEQVNDNYTLNKNDVLEFIKEIK